MSEIEVTFKIPAPPEGWQYDGFRQARPGEMWLCKNEWDLAGGSTASWYPVAVKAPPPWEPPQVLVNVLRPGWIAMDGGNLWYWYPHKPEYIDDSRMWRGHGTVLSLGVVDHLLPTHIPAKDSLRKIGEPQQ